MSDFSEILGGLRREAGLSQRRVALELGVSQALLSHYENGAREPRLDFVSRVCEYYGVTADYLLGRTSDRGRSSGVTLTSCPDGAEPLIKTLCDIFMELYTSGNNELTALTIRYLSIPVENVRELLKNPRVSYDPLRDAEMKTVESHLVAGARQRIK